MHGHAETKELVGNILFEYTIFKKETSFFQHP